MRARYTVGARERHKKVLKRAKGFQASRHYRFKVAKEAVTHAMHNEYVARRLRKRDMRALWITRLNAAVRMEGMSYSRFIDGLNKAKVVINRKVLAYLAVTDFDAFKKYVEIAKAAVK